MSRPILSPAAQADINDIWDYTADNWSIEQADRYVLQIREACASMSSDGREGRSMTDVRQGYLKLTIGSHFIIFRLVDDVVEIIRILHQRIDIPSHLHE